MAYIKLHYGGESYSLDYERGQLFSLFLRKALAEGGVQLIDAPLIGGKKLTLAVSASIPIAIEESGETQTPVGGDEPEQDAMFV